MKRRVLVLVPLYTTPEDAAAIRKYLGRYAWSGTEIDVVCTQENIAVNSRAERDYAVSEFVDLAIKAQKDGYDAVISYCYADVGVEASQRMLKIPVVGPFSASSIVAKMLGEKFSLLSIEFPAVRGLKRVPYGPSKARELGIEDSFVSTREIPFDKFFVFSDDPERVEIMKNALLEAGFKAISDGAQVLILACTGFLIPLEELKVPVIDSSITIKIAEALIDLKRGSSTHAERISGKKVQTKMRVKVIVPTRAGLKSKTVDGLKKILNDETELSIVTFKEGPKAIRSAYDAAKISRFILTEANNASKENFDAVVIGTFEDYCLDSARELCDIPVVGLGETAMLFSGFFGSKISVITSDRQFTPLIEKIARTSGVERKLLSVRPADIEGAKKEEALEEVKKAANEGAEAVIMGMIGAQELIQSIQPAIDVPILDPLSIALKMAEVLCSLKLSHSKILYPRPALPAYHKMRLKKLKGASRVRKKLDSCMYLYGLEENLSHELKAQ